MAKAAIWAICLFPIWGSLLWELWEGSIRPLLVPRSEIDALSVAMLVQHADRAEQMAFIKEDRAWRYSDSFEQGSGGGYARQSSACVTIRTLLLSEAEPSSRKDVVLCPSARQFGAPAMHPGPSPAPFRHALMRAQQTGRASSEASSRHRETTCQNSPF
jgi:hypothetical protein